MNVSSRKSDSGIVQIVELTWPQLSLRFVFFINTIVDSAIDRFHIYFFYLKHTKTIFQLIQLLGIQLPCKDAGIFFFFKF